tara:strand:- start:6307 stop:6585 length:279 start_codon:yes stop_codon:yes gene_type:complete
MVLDFELEEFDSLAEDQIEVIYACYMLKSMEKQYGFTFTKFSLSEEVYDKCEKMEFLQFKLSQPTMFEIFEELEALGLLQDRQTIKKMMAKG